MSLVVALQQRNQAAQNALGRRPSLPVQAALIAVARRRAGGLGAFEPGWEDIYGVGDPPPLPTGGVVDIGMDDSRDGPTWWQLLIPNAAQTIQRVYSPWQAQAAVAASQRPIVQYTSSPNESGSVPSGVGLAITRNGIRLSDGSYIGWLPIGGVVVAVFLLQSKGFSRR